MANKPEGQNSLQRGKACLRCRKRKMRCDGVKPACQQCVRAKKADGCEYDDGKGKTRTQILRETIMRLEERIRELEDADYVSPAVQLYDPHLVFHHHSESSSSSLGSPHSTGGLASSHSPFASESTSSPQGSWTHLPSASPPTPYANEMFFDDTPSHFQTPPFELGPVLLDIFAPHRHQCGMEVHLGQLKESLNQPMSEQRHPALMNSIYLWACFVSRPEPLCQHEDHFLLQALDAHRDGLRSGEKVIDLIRASCLLSLYFLANGRLLEGSYHASAAAGLAVQCGLHSGIMQDTSSWIDDDSEAFDIKPPKLDCLEGERILAFWQVYNLDRCWSVALHKPSVIPDGMDRFNAIHCPWPQSITDYESGHLGVNAAYQTVQSFLEGDVAQGGFSTQALRAKASALFAKADQLANTWATRMKTPNHFQEDLQSLELTISRFIPTLIPIHQLEATSLEDKRILIVAHTLAHAAIIHLYQRFAQEDHVAYEKCSRAASAIVTIAKHIGEQDFDFLDPIIGTCWKSASDILFRNLNAFSATWPLGSNIDIRNEIGTLLYAMTSLSTRFPIFGLPVSKIQKRLGASL